MIFNQIPGGGKLMCNFLQKGGSDGLGSFQAAVKSKVGRIHRRGNQGGCWMRCCDMLCALFRKTWGVLPLQGGPKTSCISMRWNTHRHIDIINGLVLNRFHWGHFLSAVGFYHPPTQEISGAKRVTPWLQVTVAVSVGHFLDILPSENGTEA